MSRIDPAEFDRLARRKNDAQQEYYDAIKKERESVIETKMKHNQFIAAADDFQKYIAKNQPPSPPHPDMVTIGWDVLGNAEPIIPPTREMSMIDPRTPFPPVKITSLPQPASSCPPYPHPAGPSCRNP